MFLTYILVLVHNIFFRKSNIYPDLGPSPWCARLPITALRPSLIKIGPGHGHSFLQSWDAAAFHLWDITLQDRYHSIAQWIDVWAWGRLKRKKYWRGIAAAYVHIGDITFESRDVGKQMLPYRKIVVRMDLRHKWRTCLPNIFCLSSFNTE